MSQGPLVLIMAAGLGTRMKSDTPKVLHKVAGRPLLHWVVTAARAAGASKVVAILGHKSEVVKAALDASFGADAIGVVIQAEQRGTGHAVQCALPALVNESDEQIVVVLTGDAPLLRSERISELYVACEKSSAGMALLSTVPPRPMPYGRLVREGGKLVKIVEHSDATPEQRQIQDTNAGFYAIKLGHLRKDLAALRADNAKGELYLTDLVAAAAARGNGATSIDAPFTEVSGINDRVDLSWVETEARKRINEAWMREGVTMTDPATTYIDAEVGPIGKDVSIGPNVALRGKTSIGDGVRIDLGCVLTDVAVGEAVNLKPYSVLTESVVGPRCQIGPFSHCRPASRLDEDVHLGNFVETKKSHLMAGAKANHLAYLGDASVGAKSNIGAGTITCNYDGVGKHKTTIEAGAFIGSNSTLVAPVTIGREAYTAAGGTVTKDVPRGALAISRVVQVNRDGWADRFREVQSKRKVGG